MLVKVSNGYTPMENWRTPKVENWLSRLNPNTARVNATIFKNYMIWVKQNGGEYANFTPDQMIEHQEEATNSHRYHMVDLMQRYIVSLEHARAGYKRKVRSTIRSFYTHNRAELPKDPSFIIRADVQRVIGTLTLKEVKAMILACNPAYQAVYLSMFQGGLGKSEFEYWNLNGWEKLEADLKGNPEVIKIDLPGRKKSRNIRPYYSLLGPDSITAIRNWLQHRPEDSPAIFTNKYGDPILADAAALYWIRHLRRLGIIEKKENGEKSNRYGKNLHELRTLFRSQWEKSPAKVSVAEYLMGHEVDPLDYNQAFRDEKWTRGEYKKALPQLQIISSGRPFGQVNEDRVKDLESTVSMLSTKNEELEAELAKRNEGLRRVEDDMKELKRLVLEELGKKR